MRSDPTRSGNGQKFSIGLHLTSSTMERAGLRSCRATKVLTFIELAKLRRGIHPHSAQSLLPLAAGPAAIIVPLVATSPALAGILGIAILHERAAGRQYAGIAVALIGAALLPLS